MKAENLFYLLQNSCIGAIALHSFTIGYNNIAKHKTDMPVKYPLLNYMFYVLPIVYNHKALSVIKSSNELYSAILKDSSITLGLQDRANKMSINTFDSLNIAFSKLILTYSKENNTIETLRGFQSNKLPLPLSYNQSENTVKMIQDCAFKLGAIFSKRSAKNIEIELNISL